MISALIGFAAGAIVAFACCVVWAYRAMSPFA